MEMIQAIFVTGGILVGLVVLGLVMQALHYAQMTRILRHLTTITDKLMVDYGTQGSFVSLEDLIQRDLMEQMGEHSPKTDRQVQQLVEEMRSPSDKEILDMFDVVHGIKDSK